MKVGSGNFQRCVGILSVLKICQKSNGRVPQARMGKFLCGGGTGKTRVLHFRVSSLVTSGTEAAFAPTGTSSTMSQSSALSSLISCVIHLMGAASNLRHEFTLLIRGKFPSKSKLKKESSRKDADNLGNFTGTRKTDDNIIFMGLSWKVQSRSSLIRARVALLSIPHKEEGGSLCRRMVLPLPFRPPFRAF